MLENKIKNNVYNITRIDNVIKVTFETKHKIYTSVERSGDNRTIGLMMIELKNGNKICLKRSLDKPIINNFMSIKRQNDMLEYVTFDKEEDVNNFLDKLSSNGYVSNVKRSI